MPAFLPSRRNPDSASIGAVTGAVAASAHGSGYDDPEGFLGLNWRSIGVGVFVAVITAVATDVALSEWHTYRKKGLPK